MNAKGYGRPMNETYMPQNASPSERFVFNVRKIVQTRKGITLNELANISGVNHSYMSRKVKEGGNISLDVALKTAQYLGMTIEEVMNG